MQREKVLATLYLQSGTEADGCQCSACLSSVLSRTPAHGVETHSVFSSSSVPVFWEHTKGYASMVILSPVKLSMEMNRCIHLHAKAAFWIIFMKSFVI